MSRHRNASFVQKKNIKRKNRQLYCRRIKNKKPFLEKIKKYATECNDIEMLQKIQIENESVNHTSLAYHNNCSVKYFAKYQRQMNPPPTDDWAIKRNSHKTAKELLINYIKKEIIRHRRVLSFAHLKDCYAEFVMELYANANLEAAMFSNQPLKDFIREKLKNEISFVKISHKLFVISSEIDIESIDDEEIEEILFEQEAQEFAIKYRRNILKIKKKTFNRFHRY